MITIYEHEIEICLIPVLDEVHRRNEIFRRELSPLLYRYAVRFRGEQIDGTQEQALIRLFWKRHAQHRDALAGEDGCVTSYHNCVLKLLYGVKMLVGPQGFEPWTNGL
jgi:hypothetical protein